jgi:hypothetical protein
VPLPPARAARGAHSPLERRRFVGPWMRILDRKHLLVRPKIRQRDCSVCTACRTRRYSRRFRRWALWLSSTVGWAWGGVRGEIEIDPPKIVKIIKLVAQELFILQLHIIHENWVPTVVCGGRAGFLDGRRQLRHRAVVFEGAGRKIRGCFLWVVALDSYYAPAPAPFKEARRVVSSLQKSRPRCKNYLANGHTANNKHVVSPCATES